MVSTLPFEIHADQSLWFLISFALTHTDLQRICAPSGARSRVRLLPVVQITFLSCNSTSLFIWFLGRTGPCVVKGWFVAGLDAEGRFWQHWLDYEHLLLFYCSGNLNQSLQEDSFRGSRWMEQSLTSSLPIDSWHLALEVLTRKFGNAEVDGRRRNRIFWISSTLC